MRKDGLMLICDVCNKDTEPNDSYVLTTRQVVTAEKYWAFLLTNMSTDIRDEHRLLSNVAFAAGQRTPWLVCQTCSKMFRFDHALARDYAVRGTVPPNVPVDAHLVAKTALRALKAKLTTEAP
jgi:hypothetical protein